MALVFDSSGLYALLDRDDEAHARVKLLVQSERGALVIPSMILPEVDYFILKFLNEMVEASLLSDILSGRFVYEQNTVADLRRARDILSQVQGMRVGIVDASVVATSERLRVDRIVSLDRRHFRQLLKNQKRPFALLPDDS